VQGALPVRVCEQHGALAGVACMHTAPRRAGAAPHSGGLAPCRAAQASLSARRARAAAHTQGAATPPGAAVQTLCAGARRPWPQPRRWRAPPRSRRPARPPSAAPAPASAATTPTRARTPWAAAGGGASPATPTLRPQVAALPSALPPLRPEPVLQASERPGRATLASRGRGGGVSARDPKTYPNPMCGARARHCGVHGHGERGGRADAAGRATPARDGRAGRPGARRAHRARLVRARVQGALARCASRPPGSRRALGCGLALGLAVLERDARAGRGLSGRARSRRAGHPAALRLCDLGP